MTKFDNIKTQLKKDKIVEDKIVNDFEDNILNFIKTLKENELPIFESIAYDTLQSICDKIEYDETD